MTVVKLEDSYGLMEGGGYVIFGGGEDGAVLKQKMLSAGANVVLVNTDTARSGTVGTVARPTEAVERVENAVVDDARGDLHRLIAGIMDRLGEGIEGIAIYVDDLPVREGTDGGTLGLARLERTVRSLVAGLAPHLKANAGVVLIVRARSNVTRGPRQEAVGARMVSVVQEVADGHGLALRINCLVVDGPDGDVGALRVGYANAVSHLMMESLHTNSIVELRERYLMPL